MSTGHGCLVPGRLEPSRFVFRPTPSIPNSYLPLLVWRALWLPLPGGHAVEDALVGRGWRPEWRSVVYAYPHFHATGHELLVCVAGTARVHFGGEVCCAGSLHPKLTPAKSMVLCLSLMSYVCSADRSRRCSGTDSRCGNWRHGSDSCR